MNNPDFPPESVVYPEVEVSPERKWKDRLNTAIIGIEVGPVNEFGRFGALAVAMALSRSNPAISAFAMGGAAAAFEVPAALAAADALENSERLQHSLGSINGFAGKLKEKFGVTVDAKTSMPTKIGLAYFGGSAVSEIVKHREDASRTKEQNRRYGLGVAGSLTGVSALQGYLIAEGIQYPSPDKVAGAVLAVGSIIGAAKIFKGWVKRENRSQNNQESQALPQEEL